MALKFAEIEHENTAVRSAGSDLVAPRVPAHLKYTARTFVTVHQLAALRRPYVNAFIEATTSQKLAVRTERHRIDRLGVFGQSVDTGAPVHVPKAYGRIEAGGCEDQVHVRIGGTGTCRRPLYRVDLLRVSLQIVHAGVVFH